MKTLQEIKSILDKNKPRLFSEYPLQSIALFGSYSRNEQREISDIDIMVEFNGLIGIRFIDLGNELEELLGVKVDLVSKKGIRQKYYNLIKPDLIYV